VRESCYFFLRKQQGRSPPRAKKSSSGEDIFVGTAGDGPTGVGCKKSRIRDQKKERPTAWAHNQIKQTQAARALP
jgi:hypothetical protein